MSQENVETARKSLEAFDRRDRAAWLAVHGPDHEAVPDPSFPEAVTARGRESVWELYIRMAEPFESVSIGDAEIVDAGADKVLVHQRAAGRGLASGAQVEMDIWYVLTFREGLIVRDQLFVGRTHALEAAGLSD